MIEGKRVQRVNPYLREQSELFPRYPTTNRPQRGSPTTRLPRNTRKQGSTSEFDFVTREYLWIWFSLRTVCNDSSRLYDHFLCTII